jgi:hypothetical protein
MKGIAPFQGEIIEKVQNYTESQIQSNLVQIILQ